MEQVILPRIDSQLPFAGSRALRDPEVQNFLNTLFKEQDINAVLWDTQLSSNFLLAFQEWIRSSKKNRWQGLGAFPEACVSLGLTQTLDLFYASHKERRLRCFRGEYFYNVLSWRNHFPRWKFLDEEEVHEGDAVVISLPFSDSGEIHPQTQNVLDQCNIKSVPVLIDCAYFGVCEGLHFNFDQKCIETVGFSLSKAFPVAYARIGMRLSRVNSDDPLFVLRSMDYVNRLGVYLGEALLKKFGPDFIPEKYRKAQYKICEELQVYPSASVLFGLGGKGWEDYNRGAIWNRLCFSDHLVKAYETSF